MTTLTAAYYRKSRYFFCEKASNKSASIRVVQVDFYRKRLKN